MPQPSAIHRVIVHVSIMLVTLVFAPACRKRICGFCVSQIDRAICASKYPLAADPPLVGTYPGHTKSGAGYFYDDVLEYRVWMHPERGALPLAGDQDYFAAFACFESANAFSRGTKGAETPVVLLRQREYIDEPQPGEFVWVHGERVTEWDVKWLDESHRRRPDSIPRFLEGHRPKAPP
jgi:hypothetical protein